MFVPTQLLQPAPCKMSWLLLHRSRAGGPSQDTDGGWMPRGCEGPAVCGGGQVGAPGACGKARVVVSVPQAAVPQQHSKHNALSCGYISSVSVEACAIPQCLSISRCRQWKPELSAGCCWGRSTVLKGGSQAPLCPWPLAALCGGPGPRSTRSWCLGWAKAGPSVCP